MLVTSIFSFSHNVFFPIKGIVLHFFCRLLVLSILTSINLCRLTKGSFVTVSRLLKYSTRVDRFYIYCCIKWIRGRLIQHLFYLVLCHPNKCKLYHCCQNIQIFSNVHESFISLCSCYADML